MGAAANGGGGGIPVNAQTNTGPDTIAAGNLSSYTLQNVEYIGKWGNKDTECCTLLRYCTIFSTYLRR